MPRLNTIDTFRTTVRCVVRVLSGPYPWYTSSMTHKLSQELVDALKAAGNGELEVVSPDDNRVYFVVDGDTHRQAMEALRRQRDRDAIANGIAQMEEGEGIPLEEAQMQTRERLLSRER